MAVFTTYNVVSLMNPIVLTPDSAYNCLGNSPCIFKLPPMCGQNFRCQIVGNSNLWEVRQNANQSIACSLFKTTTGVNGKLVATSPTDVIEISCINISLDFKVQVMSGNINII